MYTIRHLASIAGIFIVLASCKPVKQVNQSILPQRVDSLTNILMNQLPDIPGIAIAIVNSRGPIFMKGYGWADKEAKIKTDVNTVFNIGSTTKSFVGLLSAIIDHEKQVMLDSPFVSYLKDVKFKNEIGRDITIRHLLSHSSGLQNPPFTFRLAYSGLIDDEGLRTSLSEATAANTKPGPYRYTNLGYNIYSYILESHLRKNWKDLLQEKIFGPLDMKMTTAYISVAKQNNWKMAAPYDAYGDNGFTRVSLVKQDNVMQSAGGMVSTISDLSKWLQMQLANGSFRGKQMFPPEVIKQTRTGYASFERPGSLFAGKTAYGLGWMIGKHEGEEIIYHEGGYPGFRAILSFMPSKDIGVAILINEELLGTRAISILGNYIYDQVTGADSTNIKYPKRIENLVALHKKEQEESIKGEADRALRPSKLSLPMQSYTGTYYNSLYGEMQVSLKNGKLAVKHGNLESESTFFTENESIRVVLVPGSGQPITFRVTGNTVTGLRYAGEEFAKQ